jgi:predicted nuclease with TOPRIM domain
MSFDTIIEHLNERINELSVEKAQMEELGAPDEESYLKTDARLDELTDLRDMLVSGD